MESIICMCLFELQNVFVQIGKFICQNCKIKLSSLFAVKMTALIEARVSKEFTAVAKKPRSSCCKFTNLWK